MTTEPAAPLPPPLIDQWAGSQGAQPTSLPGVPWAPPELVCVWPFWSQAGALNWDRNYALLRRALPALADARPTWLWCVLWPQQSKGAGTWKWHDDGRFRHPRLFRYPWPYDTAMRTGVLAFDPDRFRTLDLDVAPTLYWLHQVEAGPTCGAATSSRGTAAPTLPSWNRSANPAIVAQHHYLVHESLPWPVAFPRQWAQLGGSVAADVVVCNAQHTRRMLRDVAAQWLSPAARAALDAKTVVEPFGLVDAAWSAQAIRDGPRDAAGTPIPVVVYNHRHEGYKLADVTAGVLRELRAQGHRFDVWGTQYVGQKVGDFPIDAIVGHPDVAQYRHNIAVPGVNTRNSVHETFCIALLDSIALGQLPVAPRGVTFPELVPDDYPYLFTSVAEQMALLARLFATWPAAYEAWHERLRAHARERFGLPSFVARTITLLEDAAQGWHRAPAKPTTLAGIQRAGSAIPPGRSPLEDVARRVRRALGVQTQSMPNRRVIRALGRWAAAQAPGTMGLEWDGRQGVVTWGGP